MTKRPAPESLLQQFQCLFTAGAVGEASDGELLDRFLRQRDVQGEAAFTALVQRHGHMVMRVCRQTLRDGHAAEDAFQATFLVLAKRAHSIRNQNSLASWLFGVAYRAAASIRMEESRRHRYETQGIDRIATTSSPQDRLPDQCSELHAEIDRLPEKYRLPIVLCYFEGLTHEQAASRLAWPIGTVKTRLSRARDRLRSRLARGGWTASPAVLFQHIRPVGGPYVPPIQLRWTIEAAIRFGGGASTSVVASPRALTIAQKAVKAMTIFKLKLGGVALLGILSIGVGAVVAARQAAERGLAGQAELAAKAKGDSQPRITLRVSGTTDYDPAKLTIVRPQFDCRVEALLVDLGSVVKAGTPLLELFSTDLAVAKNDYETAVSQHSRDKKVIDSRAPLAETNAIPLKELVEAQNDEAKSRLQMKLAKDKLLVFGLTEEEIARVPDEVGVKKARMILRSRVPGIVIKRSVVRGNYYNSKDELMQIAPLDRLWVRGVVSERDADKVQMGQKLKVVFPYSSLALDGQVEFLDKAIDMDTRAAKFRTSIPNPDHRLTAGMFVRVLIETQAKPESMENVSVPTERRPETTVPDRLSELERKVDRLLKSDEKGPATSRILERLDDLERKVDRLLEGPKAR